MRESSIPILALGYTFQLVCFMPAILSPINFPRNLFDDAFVLPVLFWLDFGFFHASYIVQRVRDLSYCNCSIPPNWVDIHSKKSLPKTFSLILCPLISIVSKPLTDTGQRVVVK